MTLTDKNWPISSFQKLEEYFTKFWTFEDIIFRQFIQVTVTLNDAKFNKLNQSIHNSIAMDTHYS